MRTELEALVRAVSIESAAAFSMCGRRTAVSLGRSPSLEAALIASVQANLYQWGFCRRLSGCLEHDSSSLSAANGDDLTAELSGANHGKPRWSDGWTIVAIEPDWRVKAQKNGTVITLRPGEYLTHDGRGAAPRIGGGISTYVATETITAQPGFYFAFGEAIEDYQDEGEYVRLYWSIAASGAPPLIETLTARLNRFRVPFRFKCLRSQSQYERLDAAVLYVEKRYYQLSAQLAYEAYLRVRHHLRPASPILTKVLAPGLALAEDPVDRGSFGMHRCGILAESLWDAYERGVADDDARLEIAMTKFAQHGVAPDRPYLNPGSVDWYGFAWQGN